MENPWTEYFTEHETPYKGYVSTMEQFDDLFRSFSETTNAKFVKSGGKVIDFTASKWFFLLQCCMFKCNPLITQLLQCLVESCGRMKQWLTQDFPLSILVGTPSTVILASIETNLFKKWVFLFMKYLLNFVMQHVGEKRKRTKKIGCPARIVVRKNLIIQDEAYHVSFVIYTVFMCVY